VTGALRASRLPIGAGGAELDRTHGAGRRFFAVSRSLLPVFQSPRKRSRPGWFPAPFRQGKPYFSQHALRPDHARDRRNAS